MVISNPGPPHTCIHFSGYEAESIGLPSNSELGQWLCLTNIMWNFQEEVKSSHSCPSWDDLLWGQTVLLGTQLLRCEMPATWRGHVKTLWLTVPAEYPNTAIVNFWPCERAILASQPNQVLNFWVIPDCKCMRPQVRTIEMNTINHKRL